MQAAAKMTVFGGNTACFTRSSAAPRRPSARQAVHVAAVAAPRGVTQPPVLPRKPAPTFGFVDNAETWNSRAAMIGFFSLLAVEAIAGKGILELVGVTVGKGLNIAL